MSFGWSVTDCFAALNLLIKVFSSLKDSGGSKSDYQELLRELNGLKTALHLLEKLTVSTTSVVLSARLEELRSVALACRIPLEQFVTKVKKFDQTLGEIHDSSPGQHQDQLLSTGPHIRRQLVDTTRKIMWLGKKKDVLNLQHYLGTHVGTINMLLAQLHFEYLHHATDNAVADSQQMHGQLTAIWDAIDATEISASNYKQQIDVHLKMIRDDVQSAALDAASASQAVEERLDSLQEIARSTSSAVANTNASVDMSKDLLQEMLGVLRERLPPSTEPNPQFTWYQEPVRVEDALGRVFPVPSEYSVRMLRGVIQMMFENSPGYLDVKAGNYELSYQQDSKRILSGEDSTALAPGISILMAVIVDYWPVVSSQCPVPSCRSEETTPLASGGRKWYVLG